MKEVLKIENLKKYYGANTNITKAVDGISFSVLEGEFVAIMGASGSGKTTLLNCVATIDTVTSGHIFVDNKDITTVKENDLADFRKENLAYYKILKRANKSMLENVTKINTIQKDYKDYIESWVHEIKIPITSAKLICENNKSEITNKIDEEIEEINNYVEQALFYARLDQVSNDFMIRKINLADVVRNVLARNKKIMIQNNIKVEVKNVATDVFSDEKWLEFISNQIIINSIKYKKDQNAVITISSIDNKENVHLKIKDNGKGIKESEINRIFDKGFTGTNGRNQKKSTGIGLYLCKRLCEELDMNITAKSKENEFTEITIIIPRNKRID